MDVPSQVQSTRPPGDLLFPVALPVGPPVLRLTGRSLSRLSRGQGVTDPTATDPGNEVAASSLDPTAPVRAVGSPSTGNSTGSRCCPAGPEAAPPPSSADLFPRAASLPGSSGTGNLAQLLSSIDNLARTAQPSTQNLLDGLSSWAGSPAAAPASCSNCPSAASAAPLASAGPTGAEDASDTGSSGEKEDIVKSMLTTKLSPGEMKKLMDDIKDVPVEVLRTLKKSNIKIEVTDKDLGKAADKKQEAAGLYGSGKIQLKRSSLGTGVAVHEIGHALMDAVRKQDPSYAAGLEAENRRSFRSGGAKPSEYAKTNSDEYFAEAFKKYVTGKKSELSPDAVKDVEGYLGEAKKLGGSSASGASSDAASDPSSDASAAASPFPSRREGGPDRIIRQDVDRVRQEQGVQQGTALASAMLLQIAAMAGGLTGAGLSPQPLAANPLNAPTAASAVAATAAQSLAMALTRPSMGLGNAFHVLRHDYTAFKSKGTKLDQAVEADALTMLRQAPW